MPIGIMAAMQEKIDTLVKELPADSEVIDDGQRTYHSDHLWGTPVVVVFSRWGKVAAATTATHLIADFGVAEILFTGIAGAAQPGLKVGDVVVGAGLCGPFGSLLTPALSPADGANGPPGQRAFAEAKIMSSGSWGGSALLPKSCPLSAVSLVGRGRG